jgi:chromosome partitioning protein
LHVLDFNNIKGGVAKTTTTLDVGYALGRMGKKVLLIDLDPQANLTYSATGILSKKTAKTLYEVLIPLEPESISSIIVTTKHENVLVAPGSITLSSADLELAARPAREWILQRAIEDLATFCKEHDTTIDYILIDTPPNLGLLSVNALVACGCEMSYQTGHSGFIIPVAADVYATIGIDHLKGTIAQLRRNLRIPIPLLGAVATIVDNTNESKKFLKDIHDEFGTAMFNTMIPRNVSVKEANNYRVLFDYAPDSTGAQAYLKLTEEIIARAEAK